LTRDPIPPQHLGRAGALPDATRVLLVDDHHLILEAVGAALAATPGLTIAACVPGGATLLDVAARVAWDVMVLDLFLPDHDGLDVLRRVKTAHPSRGVLVLTSAAEEQFGLRAIRAGADGFLGKGAPLKELVHAIRVVAAGDVYASPALARALAHSVAEGRRSPDLTAFLTDRELEVVRLLAEGLSQKEIGARLFISHKTVHTHKVHAEAKLGVDGTSQLIRFALDAGLVGRVEPNAAARLDRRPTEPGC